MIELKVTGIKEALKNLKKRGEHNQKMFHNGLLLAGLFLQRQSQLIVPVDTGALRASAYTKMTGKGWKTNVVVGYRQFYAIFVHEDLQARHRPGKQAKYLEEPARIFKQQMLEIAAAQLRRKS